MLDDRMTNEISFDDNYWEARKASIYLFVAQAICQKYGREPKTVLDIGSNQTPTLEWHRVTATQLVSLDLRQPYVADGVESIRGNFLDYRTETWFDLVTCFQVLEHVRAADVFAKKLMTTGKVVVVSVPYRWKGVVKGHIHDPVDEEKMLQWFGRKPSFAYIARELNNVKRLIQVYITEPA
jgi:2-polyprenyl-3-methyl-5-hydroxy-6-metoxy-1,4-benzoquinol methylase